MPGWRTALERRIAIGNTPGANTFAVAEYTLAQILSLVRELPGLTNTGVKTFSTTKSLECLSVGVIGAGRIGETMIKMLSGIGVKTVYYWNRTRKFELESRYANLSYLSLDQLCSTADVITNHTSSSAVTLLNANIIAIIKNGAILISNGGHGAVDYEALNKRLRKSELVFAEDQVTDILKDLPIDVYYHSNSSTAFNTVYSLKKMSDMVVDFVIDVLNNNDKTRAVS